MPVTNAQFQVHQRELNTLKARRDAVRRQLNELQVDAALVEESIQTTALDAGHPTMARALDNLAAWVSNIERQARYAQQELS